MGSFIARQPNNLLCRFSSVVDTVTDINMTEEEYIEMCAERARREAREVLQNYIRPFDWIKEHFKPYNNTIEEFQNLLHQMGDSGLSKEQIKELQEYEIQI